MTLGHDGWELRYQLDAIIAKDQVHHARPIDEDQIEVHTALHFKSRERLCGVDVNKRDYVDKV